jgi:hypothetical protein
VVTKRPPGVQGAQSEPTRPSEPTEEPEPSTPGTPRAGYEVRAHSTGRSPRGEGRYRRGERRSSAEPLTASWRLDPAELEAEGVRQEQRRRQARRPRRRLKSYGWRVYALPVLVVVTILVVVNTAQHESTSQPLGDGSAQGGTSAGPPVATERPAVPVYTGSGTAVLPAGPSVPQSGAGTWHLVPGNGPVVGKGDHLYHYQVAVEDGIDPAVYGGDDAFAESVDATLDDPRSWIAAGSLSLQRVGPDFANPDFVVSLTTPNTDHRPDLCGYDITYEASCWRSSARRVIINLARWVRGALAFQGDLGLYRQYAINHEVGHVFGNPHVGCATNGGLAPVMMQQSFGVSDDYVYDLNQVDPGNRTKVPRDGKVCKANAWPYPQGPAVSADAPPG